MLHEFGIHLANGSIRPLLHRNTQADLGVIHQIYGNHDYSLNCLRRGEELIEFYHELVRNGNTPLIIDAGANIGASPVWFSLNFPGAHIICFEPDGGNFDLLKRNTTNLNISSFFGAVGAVDGKAELHDPGQGEWGYRTTKNDQGTLKMFSMFDICEAAIKDGMAPFIAKIDIEGGEGELFSANTGWVDRFQLIIIELHDWFLPKQGTSVNFLKVISGLDRDFVYMGENIFSIKN